jgi:hypothetical protein
MIRAGGVVVKEEEEENVGRGTFTKWFIMIPFTRSIAIKKIARNTSDSTVWERWCERNIRVTV